MKTLILGKDGQVGQAFRSHMPPSEQVVYWGRAELDLTDPETVLAKLLAHAPDLIINAAAYTAVDRAEAEPETADLVNHKAVAAMAEAATRLDARLVHFSTDYVFDGQKDGAYSEDDAVNPLGVYGRTKLAGEAAVQASGCRHYIFRTSWVFSAHGQNFMNTMLRLGSERDELRVVSDQFGAPTSADFIARIATAAVLADLENGLYHLTANGSVSWHGFAEAIFERFQQYDPENVFCVPKVVAIPTLEYPTPASRPGNSALDCIKVFKLLDVRQASWQELLEAEMDVLHGGD